jgi:hypothetical protein
VSIAALSQGTYLLAGLVGSGPFPGISNNNLSVELVSGCSFSPWATLGQTESELASRAADRSVLLRFSVGQFFDSVPLLRQP